MSAAVADGGGRPRLHFTARSGWINDPLAVTWHRDRYHLFFQYVPGTTTWSPDCRWGHATSPDLVSWTEQPVALEPGDGDDGVWSGCLVLAPDGRPTIFYTSVTARDFDGGLVRTATPLDDDWVRWRKGPVVVRPPAAPRTLMFRDPSVSRDGERWRMIVGAALEDDTAGVLAFSSDDLIDWRDEGVFAQRSAAESDGTWTGVGWECPQLIEVDGVTVLVVSVWEPSGLHYVAAATGRVDDGRFSPTRWQRLTGDRHYAATSFHDADGRPCLMFWLRNTAAQDGSWTGALSVPHVLSVDRDRVRLAPHPAVAAAARPDADGLVLEDGPVLETWSGDGMADARSGTP